MNILVFLRAVRDPAGFTVNRKAQKIFVNREAFIPNPSDRNALEAALQLAGAEGSVTALACGGEPELEVLRRARALGAGRAIWVALPDGPAPDALGVARILQHAVSYAGPIDLVLLGAEALADDTAQVGARLAAALDWPYVESAWEARDLPDGGLGLVVAGDGPGGAYRLLGVDAPAVASVARDANKPRFAPAARIMTIYQSPDAVEQVTPADLGLDPAELAPVTTVRGESFPPERTLGRVLTGEGAIQQLVDALKG